MYLQLLQNTVNPTLTHIIEHSKRYNENEWNWWGISSLYLSVVDPFFAEEDDWSVVARKVIRFKPNSFIFWGQLKTAIYKTQLAPLDN